MAVWVIRAGSPVRNTEIEEMEGYALDEGILSINYNFTRSVHDFYDRDELREYILEDPTRAWRTNSYLYLWCFANEVQVDDILLLPLHANAARSGFVAVGRVTSDYDFSPGIGSDDYSVGPHFRNVAWLVRDVPQEDFDLDFHLGRPPTIFEITADDAENRIQQIVDDRLGQGR